MGQQLDDFPSFLLPSNQLFVPVSRKTGSLSSGRDRSPNEGILIWLGIIDGYCPPSFSTIRPLPIPEVRAKNGDACVRTSSEFLSFLRFVIPAHIARRKSPWSNCFDCRCYRDQPPALARATFVARQSRPTDTRLSKMDSR